MGTQSFETNGQDGGFATVINDSGKGRLWYTGINDSMYIYKIGLVESNWTAAVLSALPRKGRSAAKMEVYNVSGQRVVSARLPAAGLIEVSGLTAGAYVVRAAHKSAPAQTIVVP
jgi:hypothetical protein